MFFPKIDLFAEDKVISQQLFSNIPITYFFQGPTGCSYSAQPRHLGEIPDHYYSVSANIYLCNGETRGNTPGALPGRTTILDEEVYENSL